ncbi:hypothetical protein CNMCM8812_001542 [Aspergillus fumigatus]|nr:hypothetical protein CNMCM8714_006202 [Aspergillus fumigatus]KAF4269300.1 hypothetical protein CNMCM8812_001542 [Aspergillus fumigatus]KAH1287199.1 hypothetical protein KXX11_002202 [Aspergillus fumigatus]KAH1442333.1 hypothetical protein KXX13_006309 [Aspergillus fumigatus]KAH1501442.1 hypothetical protein KXX06_001249 [Aspergillus fumigatus]
MGQLSSFVRSSAADKPFETPRLTLTLEGESCIDLSSDTSYPLIIKIMRDEDDPQTQPCIIRWDPMTDAFGQPGIMLVRSNRDFTEDLQPVQVDSSHLRAKSVHPREVSRSDPCFKELYPGSSVSWELDLPSVYFNSLRPGERYRILWVGGQISLWNWGTLAQLSGCTLSPKSLPVILPGGPHQLLRILEVESDIDEVGPLPPSPAPILASGRVSGAPVFSLTIAGPATLSMRDRNSRGRLRYPVTMTLSYDAAPDGLDRKPVTFHTPIFKDIDSRQGGFRLYFREQDHWSPHELPGSFTYHRYRFSKSVPVNVGRNEQDEFVALMPGESWSFTREVTDFPKHAAPGDEFRYRFKGAQLDWWDWGHLGDHENTIVWVNYLVRDPKDNGGRPGLVVPASNWVEFTMVE